MDALRHASLGGRGRSMAQAYIASAPCAVVCATIRLAPSRAGPAHVHGRVEPVHGTPADRCTIRASAKPCGAARTAASAVEREVDRGRRRRSAADGTARQRDVAGDRQLTRRLDRGRVAPKLSSRAYRELGRKLQRLEVEALGDEVAGKWGHQALHAGHALVVEALEQRLRARCSSSPPAGLFPGDARRWGYAGRCRSVLPANRHGRG